MAGNSLKWHNKKYSLPTLSPISYFVLFFKKNAFEIVINDVNDVQAAF